VIEPKLMGKSVGLHPITVLMALIFWGMLWGFVGMLLSVPLTLTLRILFDQSEFTRPLANAMAGNLPEPAEADAR
jgi:AI-2 transport protein TqsA